MFFIHIYTSADGVCAINIFYRKTRQIIDTFGSHLNVELQQRGVEFSQLFRRHAPLRSALLERMPPLEIVAQNNDEENEDSSSIHCNGDDTSDANSPTLHRTQDEVMIFFDHEIDNIFYIYTSIQLEIF